MHIFMNTFGKWSIDARRGVPTSIVLYCMIHNAALLVTHSNWRHKLVHTYNI